MTALLQLGHGRAFLRSKRDGEVARVVNGGRWKIDLRAGFRHAWTRYDLVETSDGQLDAIDDENSFVRVKEIHTDLALAQHGVARSRGDGGDFFWQPLGVATGHRLAEAHHDEGQAEPYNGAEGQSSGISGGFHGSILAANRP